MHRWVLGVRCASVPHDRGGGAARASARPRDIGTVARDLSVPRTRPQQTPQNEKQQRVQIPARLNHRWLN